MKKSIFINAVGLLLFFSSCENQESPTTQQAPSEEKAKPSREEIEIQKQIKELKTQLQNPNLSKEEKEKYSELLGLKNSILKFKEKVENTKQAQKTYPAQMKREFKSNNTEVQRYLDMTTKKINEKLDNIKHFERKASTLERELAK